MPKKIVKIIAGGSLLVFFLAGCQRFEPPVEDTAGKVETVDAGDDSNLHEKLETIRKTIHDTGTIEGAENWDLLASDVVAYEKNKIITSMGAQYYEYGRALINPLAYPNKLADFFNQKVELLLFDRRGITAKLVYKETSDVIEGNVMIICFPFFNENNAWKAHYALYEMIPNVDFDEVTASTNEVREFCPLSDNLPEELIEVTEISQVPGHVKMSSVYYRTKIYINGILQPYMSGNGSSYEGYVIGGLNKVTNTIKIDGTRLNYDFGIGREIQNLSIVIKNESDGMTLYEYSSGDAAIYVTDEFEYL